MHSNFVDVNYDVTTGPQCMYASAKQHLFETYRTSSKTKSAVTDSVGVILVIRHELTVAQQVRLKTTMNS